jgi:predicted component of type VI protein secretion system
MLQYVLRFVAGKDQGREFPLPPELNIVIGRVSDVDLLLLDEKVSRKHAKISTHAGQVIIEDLASRNGTFVNGARIRNAELKEGDQIAIGASTIALVSLGDARPRLPQPAVPPGAAAPGSSSPAFSALISGSIHEMPLPDLLQLFTNSRKSGVTDHPVRTTVWAGSIFARAMIYHAEIEGNPIVKPRKAFLPHVRVDRRRFRPETDPATTTSRRKSTDSATSLILGRCAAVGRNAYPGAEAAAARRPVDGSRTAARPTCATSPRKKSNSSNSCCTTTRSRRPSTTFPDPTSRRTPACWI